MQSVRECVPSRARGGLSLLLDWLASSRPPLLLHARDGERMPACPRSPLLGWMGANALHRGVGGKSQCACCVCVLRMCPTAGSRVVREGGRHGHGGTSPAQSEETKYTASVVSYGVGRRGATGQAPFLGLGDVGCCCCVETDMFKAAQKGNTMSMSISWA